MNERPLSQTRREMGDSKNRHSPICTRLWNSQWIVKQRHVTCVIRSVEPTAPALGTIMESNLLQHDTACSATYTTKSRPQLTDVFYEGMRWGECPRLHSASRGNISVSGSPPWLSQYRISSSSAPRTAHAICIATGREAARASLRPACRENRRE